MNKLMPALTDEGASKGISIIFVRSGKCCLECTRQVKRRMKLIPHPQDYWSLNFKSAEVDFIYSCACQLHLITKYEESKSIDTVKWYSFYLSGIAV